MRGDHNVDTADGVFETNAEGEQSFALQSFSWIAVVRRGFASYNHIKQIEIRGIAAT